jgi:hypothetical protein
MAKNTLLQKPSMAQARNMWGTKLSVIHVDRVARSILMTDFSERSVGITEFSVPNMFKGIVSRDWRVGEVDFWFTISYSLQLMGRKNNSKTKVEKVFFCIFMSSYAEMSFLK